MATHGESNRRPAPTRGASAGPIATAVALALAATAAGGAIWLSSARGGNPWETVLYELTTSGESCSLESDAAARAASKVARSRSQLEGFIRDRFQQLQDRAITAGQEERLAAVEAAQAQAAIQPVFHEPEESAQLRSRLAELVAQRASLLDRVTLEHPQVLALSHQIDALDAQVAALPLPPASPLAEGPPEEVEIGPVPADAVKSLVEQSAADYQQLATACHRAERHWDEAQAGNAAAIDRHLGQLGQLDEATAAWDRLAGAATAVTQSLWAVAGIAFAIVAWLALRDIAGQWRPKAEQMITDASQIERWFSLPVVAVAGPHWQAAARDHRRRIPHWLVLPAQLVFAMAVFAAVAATIQNPTWLGDMAGDPWQAIGSLWAR